MGDMVHFIDLYQQDTEKYFERRHCGHHGQSKIYHLFRNIFFLKEECVEFFGKWKQWANGYFDSFIEALEPS